MDYKTEEGILNPQWATIISFYNVGYHNLIAGNFKEWVVEIWCWRDITAVSLSNIQIAGENSYFHKWALFKEI